MTDTHATTVTAAVVRTPGDPDSIELVDVPTPVAGPGEVLIDVAYAGVNPVDLSTRAGGFHDAGLIAADAAQTGLGWEVSGTIAGTDTRVAALLPGLDRPTGGYAARVVVPEADVALVPDGLSLEDAATVPLNALTAAQLLDLAGPAAGRTLLVTGAAGSVGFYTLLLARELGFAVTGLARAADEELIRSTGADLAVSPTGAFDVVADPAVLGETALDLVAEGGLYVGVIPGNGPAARAGVTVDIVGVVADGVRLAELLRLTEAGELPARVRAVLPMGEAAQAHRALEKGGVRGRYLLRP